jgi:hypothetical protein
LTERDVLASGVVNGSRLVLLTTDAHEEEATQGGKAAQLWLAQGGAQLSLLSDYLSYDLGCEVEDDVCQRVKPDGLGLVVVWHEQDRDTVLIALKADRRPNVRTAEGDAIALDRTAGGYIGTGRTQSPWEMIVSVDGSSGRYRLPLPVGGVVSAGE